MAKTSLKPKEDINIHEKIFRENHVADMQGELDLYGDVVSNDLTSVVDTPSVRVNDSTTRIDVEGVEGLSKKHEESGRIPSFLMFLCLFLAKRGSMCVASGVLPIKNAKRGEC